MIELGAPCGAQATSNQEKARAFGAMLGILYLCTAVGPLIGGNIQGDFGQLTNGTCAFCHGGKQQLVLGQFFATNVVCLVLLVLFFPETAPQADMVKKRTAVKGNAPL